MRTHSIFRLFVLGFFLFGTFGIAFFAGYSGTNTKAEAAKRISVVGGAKRSHQGRKGNRRYHSTVNAGKSRHKTAKRSRHSFSIQQTVGGASRSGVRYGHRNVRGSRQDNGYRSSRARGVYNVKQEQKRSRIRTDDNPIRYSKNNDYETDIDTYGNFAIIVSPSDEDFDGSVPPRCAPNLNCGARVYSDGTGPRVITLGDPRPGDYPELNVFYPDQD